MITGSGVYQELNNGLITERGVYNGQTTLIELVKTTDDSVVYINPKDVENLKKIQTEDSPSVDAFGRFRVSENYTLFDSKQLFDGQPLLWDDAQLSGTGTYSSYSTGTASTLIGVSNLTVSASIEWTEL